MCRQRDAADRGRSWCGSPRSDSAGGDGLAGDDDEALAQEFVIVRDVDVPLIVAAQLRAIRQLRLPRLQHAIVTTSDVVELSLEDMTTNRAVAAGTRTEARAGVVAAEGLAAEEADLRIELRADEEMLVAEAVKIGGVVDFAPVA